MLNIYLKIYINILNIYKFVNYLKKINWIQDIIRKENNNKKKSF